MIKNYLKITFRNLLRFKVFTFINIIGMTIGITCFLLLFLYVIDELGFDLHHKNADKIYRIYIKSSINGNTSNNSKTAAPLGEKLKNEFPEVESYTRIGYFGQHIFRYNNSVHRENSVYTADSTYFSIFTHPLILGNPKTVLSRSNSIVINESSAKKYFGNENPIGKQIIVDDTTIYTVTGVMQNFPKKSHFSCSFLLSMSTYKESEGQNWLDSDYTTYVLFNREVNTERFEEKLKKIVKSNVFPQAEKIMGISMKDFSSKGNYYNYYLQPLTSIYLYSQPVYNIELNTEWSHTRSSNIYYVYIFMLIGFFILLLAILNFVNLTTAKSESRSKEIGIRKTLGAARRNLIYQFISESTLISLISVTIAYIVVQSLLSPFNNFFGRDITFNLLANYYVFPLLIVLTIVIGILSGSYPAFYLSSIQISHILKLKAVKRKNNLRSVLVIIQFVISVTLIICTLIIKSQLEYLLTKDLGFRKDQLIVINNASELKNTEIFKNELSYNSNIISSTVSSLMFQSGIPGGTFLLENASPNDFIVCQFIDTDYDFLKTYDVTLLAGRDFSKDFSTDKSSVILNESAVHAMKIVNPIGKTIRRIKTNSKGYEELQIVGIIKNFNYESLHQKIRPLILRISPINQPSSIITIRTRSNDFSSTLQNINNIWEKLTNEKKLNCTLLDDNIKNMYETEVKVGKLTIMFSSIAILIACLGLFALTAYVVEKKTKEIGIRKVLGATTNNIIIYLSNELLRWVLIANIISFPIAYFLMKNWLQNFAFRIEITVWFFMLSGLLSVLIAMIIISSQTIKAANSNPVKNIKSE